MESVKRGELLNNLIRPMDDKRLILFTQDTSFQNFLQKETKRGRLSFDYVLDDNLSSATSIQKEQLPITDFVTLDHGSKCISGIALDGAGCRMYTVSYDFNVKLWDFHTMGATRKSFRQLTAPCGEYRVRIWLLPFKAYNYACLYQHL